MLNVDIMKFIMDTLSYGNHDVINLSAPLIGPACDPPDPPDPLTCRLHPPLNFGTV